MAIAFKQLELDLWGDLKSALDEPQAANFHELWQELEQAIAPLEKYQQLHVAGEVIAQILEIYVKRANGILDGLEVTDNNTGPVLDDDFLSGLMRQSMSLDLSDLMEDLFELEETDKDASGSIVALVDQKAAIAIATQARRLAKKELLDLAGQENIELWRNAIATWMQQRQGQKVSLWQLQQALDMSLVEVWLGLLHGNPNHYQWQLGKEFYNDAQDIYLSAASPVE